MFAVVEAGSKQYHVKVGDVVNIERISNEAGSTYTFEKVLMADGKVGSPNLDNAKVVAEVLEHKKSDKVLIFKKKRRHNYRRKRGHRQEISVLRIKEIKA